MTSETAAIPLHIGFIMDGNRRWARERGLPLLRGHLAGYEAARRVSEACDIAGVKFVTFYSFSTENWRRDKAEVSYLMKLLMRAVSAKEIKYALEHGLRLRFLGRRDKLAPSLLRGIDRAEEATKAQTKGTRAFCIDYGGQQEIADAARKCVEDGLRPEEVTPEAIAARLYCPDIPPMDLMVRTSGEQRLSNFMLWRAEYSEFLFVQKHWPDMTKADITDIIETYGHRSRRFGG